MRGLGSVKEALGRELGRFGAVLELSWGRPGAVLGRSWAPAGLPWAPLGPLEALLGSSWDHLGHLKYIQANTQKHQNTLIRIAFLGPGESQEESKMSPSWGQVGFQRTSETILATSRAILTP